MLKGGRDCCGCGCSGRTVLCLALDVAGVASNIVLAVGVASTTTSAVMGAIVLGVAISLCTTLWMLVIAFPLPERSEHRATCGFLRVLICSQVLAWAFIPATASLLTYVTAGVTSACMSMHILIDLLVDDDDGIHGRGYTIDIDRDRSSSSSASVSSSLPHAHDDVEAPTTATTAAVVVVVVP